MKWSWYYVAQYIIEPVYGGYVDWEEEFFECPECGEHFDCECDCCDETAEEVVEEEVATAEEVDFEA